ncbi:MAG: ABC transporter substrate-binding subunit SaoX [Romboutsia sp.]
MNLSKKAKILLSVTLLSTMIITGCSSTKESEGEKSEVSDYTIKLGYYNCDHMTAAPVAVEAGIYEELGLKVEAIGNGKVPEAMAAGQMDAGYIGTKGLVGAIPKGSPIVVAANNHSGGSEYLVVSNDIEKPEDLIGQKIASDPNGDLLWTTDYGPETGLPVDSSKYECINMDSSKDAYLAMKTGQIKAFTACDPWGSVAEHEGVGKIISTTKYKQEDGTEYNCCSFSLNKNFIEEHPQLAEKMVLAHTKAIEYIYTNPLESAKIFAKAYSVDEEVALRTIYKKTVGEGRTLTWTITGEEYKNNLDMYKKYNALEEIPAYEEVVYDKLLKSCGANDFDTFIKEKVDSEYPVGMSYEDWKAKVNG